MNEELKDWEQRRYEIARGMQRSIFETVVLGNSPEKQSAEMAVKYADALIEELRPKTSK